MYWPIIVVCVSVMAGACGGDEPAACDVAVQRATQVYRDCVARLGVEVVHFALSPEGDIEVEFSDGTTQDQEQQVLEMCEPATEQTFQLTAIACEHVVVGQPATAQDLIAQIDAAARQGFSGSISVVRDHQIVFETSRGMADRELGVANDPTTAFDVGSIMKDLTAVAVFRLEAEGKLRRADSVERWFAVPADKAAITIDHLLGHRAGLHEYHDVTGDFEPLTRSAALDRIFAQPLRFAPGAEVAYSNSGYTLLAAIVEEASGESFWSYVHAFLDASGLASTGTYADPRWERSRVAVGYDAATHGDRNSPFDWPAPTWALIGNGGLVSNVSDLDRFLVGVAGGALLAGEAATAFRRDYRSPTELKVGGASLFAATGGNDYGFAAIAADVPDRGVRIVVTSNAAEVVSPELLGVQLLMSAMGEFIDVPR
jgi:CubicO group peptidase (beta-lactamase class C family)